jgi:putative ABC transport system substrate-binding protein
MQRREFITPLGSAALGGAAATWPLSVYGQQPDQMRRVGVLMAYAERDREGQAFVTTFREGLQSPG